MRRRLPAEVMERATKTAEFVLEPTVVQIDCGNCRKLHTFPAVFVGNADEGTVHVVELDEARDLLTRLTLLVDICEAHEGRSHGTGDDH